MDDSFHSGDVFFNSPNSDESFGLKAPQMLQNIDFDSLNHKVNKTKDVLLKGVQRECDAQTPEFFHIILSSCEDCVVQTLQVLTSLLEQPDVELETLCQYLEDLISILQMFAQCLKNFMESSLLNCHEMDIFPCSTGRVLVALFNHCKESEIIYGARLLSMQIQLKELFKTCHELQLIYLVILEKHFVFDMANGKDQTILMEVLDINLRIGEIVESLDLKTMAEQWKAYTLLCEKYCKELSDHSVFYKCTRSLCDITVKNINIALDEETKEQKTIVRSLKLSNFVLKIIIRMCLIFKNNNARIYENLLELLLFVYSRNAPQLTYDKRPAQLVNLVNSNVLNAADALVAELASHEGFAHCLLQQDVLRTDKEGNTLGYVVLLCVVAKSILQKSEDLSVFWMNSTRNNFLEFVLNLLQNCHTIFTLPLSFPTVIKNDDYEYCGLYEYLLTHVSSLLIIANEGFFRIAERKLYEALFSSNVIVAMFVVDLWILVARMSSPHLRLNQLKHLCETFQKLEPNLMFMNSPQKIHLSTLIEALFKLLSKEEKYDICKKFNVEDNNFGLWSILKLKNLPTNVQNGAEEFVVDRMKDELQKINSMMSVQESDIVLLIKLTKLTSTCSFMKLDNIEEETIQFWLKFCDKNLKRHEKLTRNNVWHFQLLESLYLLTESMIPLLQRNSAGLTKVLHVLSSIFSSQIYIEAKLSALKLIFKLALYNPPTSSRTQIDSLFHQIFRRMLLEDNTMFKDKFYETVRSHSRNSRVKEFIANIVSKEAALEDEWNYFLENNVLPQRSISLEEQLKKLNNINYSHVCYSENVVNDHIEVAKLDRHISSNFGFDLDMLLGESDLQPASKKFKIDNDPDLQRIDAVLHRMEKDSEELKTIKENVPIDQFKNRILSLCNKIRSVIE